MTNPEFRPERKDIDAMDRLAYATDARNLAQDAAALRGDMRRLIQDAGAFRPVRKASNRKMTKGPINPLDEA